MVVGLVGGGAFTWQAFRPVRELLDTLRHITHTGRLDARVPVGDEGDVAQRARPRLERDAGTHRALVTGMRNALDAVAHDLRTPIARLRGRAEQALLAPPDVDRYREALEDTVEEADRVSSLLTTLMDISEAEAGTMQLRREPVDVARVLRETLDLYEDLAEARGVHLAIGGAATGLTVNADYARLRQALANLVDNAVKYTTGRRHVTVGAESRPERGGVGRAGHRARHCRASAGANLGTALSRRGGREGARAWARPEPGARRRRSPRRTGGGGRCAGSRQHVHARVPHRAVRQTAPSLLQAPSAT